MSERVLYMADDGLDRESHALLAEARKAAAKARRRVVQLPAAAAAKTP